MSRLQHSAVMRADAEARPYPQHCDSVTVLAMPSINPSKSPLSAAEVDAALRRAGAIKTDALRAMRRGFSQTVKSWSGGEVLRLAEELLGFGPFAHRFMAYELIAAHRGAREALNATVVQRLARGLDSWESVDTFACYVAGPAWREGFVPESVIVRWSKAPDRWLRRSALVCTVALNNQARGGRGDAARTTRICELLMADRDDMVVKAMSWALRELAKRDAAAAGAFVRKHADELAPRVMREVGNKLRTGKKNP